MSSNEQATLVTADMADRKGVWGNERTSPPISESDIRKWAIATYWPEKPPSIYWDPDYASTTRYGGIIAPPDFNPFAWPVDRPRPRVATKRDKNSERRGQTGLNGGQTDTYGVPMKAGDIIRSRSRLKDWNERQGRMGLMLYTFTETEWCNQFDELVRTRISTGIRY